MKLITTSIWITTAGAFPHKMLDLTGTMDQVIAEMRVYAPQLGSQDAKEIVTRAAFTSQTVWHTDRSIGILVAQVVGAPVAAGVISMNHEFFPQDLVLV